MGKLYLLVRLLLPGKIGFFRDKHGNQSGLYTELAEKQHVLTIVPPIVTRNSSVYDMSNYEHLKKWKDKMQAAYDYIVYQIGYMQAMLRKKAERGEYDGRPFPPGLVAPKEGYYVGPHKFQIYQPWKDVMAKLAERLRALNWDWLNSTKK